ncbi:ABC transporter permease [Brevibacillus fluminis]|uniref:ABC transporter permease n=1 Tax=Brevibacillus fluminis TaxID=511487 RepID=A0A3M8DWU8_9BACL|nr:ABC transporter permease [Brevibacillus fluminis]RNB91771.1 ABC transporter permease [Brevibacillus fluminis]
MLRYTVGRILHIIPTLIVVIFIIFFILNVVPGNPGRVILGKDADAKAVAALNHDLGMDRPMLERFGTYLLDVSKLDFGNSYRSGRPVFEEILAKFPTTLTLALLAVVAMSIIGIPLGIVSAVKQYSALDYSLTVTALLLASVPGFFLALVLILIFSLGLGILPSMGAGTPLHYVLPVITLALPNAAFLARLIRTSMLETMRQDYIRTAKAKGAGKLRVIMRHALKPALMPIITILGMTFAWLLGGALIIEMIYGLPGIGNIIIKAVHMKDTPVIMAVTIFLAVLYKLIMLAVDIIQAVVDPRLKNRLG